MAPVRDVPIALSDVVEQVLKHAPPGEAPSVITTDSTQKKLASLNNLNLKSVVADDTIRTVGRSAQRMYINESTLVDLLDRMPSLTMLDLGQVANRSRGPVLPRESVYNKSDRQELYRAIGTLTNLHSLSLRNFGPWNKLNQLESAASVAELARALHGLSQLVQLDLRGVHIEREQELVNVLQQVPGLTTLKLFDDGSSHDPDSGKMLCETIRRITGLRHLSIVGTGEWSQHVAISLADTLRSLTKLEELHMEGNFFCSQGATALADAMHGLTQLLTLKMGTMNADGYRSKLVSAKVAAVLNEPLQAMSSLRTLATYESFECSLKSIQKLAFIIRQLPTLTWLDVGGYRFGDDGATALADALKGLKRLTTLDLSFNRIGARGASKLAPAMQCLSEMTELNLSWNCLMELDTGSPLGLEALALSVAVMTDLTSLDLSGNDILQKMDELVQAGNNFGERAIETLARALSNTTKMTCLRVSTNPHQRHPEAPGILTCHICQPLRDALIEMESLSQFHIAVHPSKVDWGIKLPEEFANGARDTHVLRRDTVYKAWPQTLAYVRELRKQGRLHALAFAMGTHKRLGSAAPMVAVAGGGSQMNSQAAQMGKDCAYVSMPGELVQRMVEACGARPEGRAWELEGLARLLGGGIINERAST